MKLLSGDVDTFCHDLVEATGVLLLPGSVFDDDGNRFRIGFGRADLADALPAFESFLYALISTGGSVREDPAPIERRFAREW